MDARVAVIVPCFNSGRLIVETIASLAEEPEPLEVVVVDDRSDDPETQQALAELRQRGVRVIRERENRGAAAARTAGLYETTAPFVFPLDADDLAIPGRIGAAADLLEANPDAVAVIGDYEEFGNDAIVRAVPEALDPYRVAYTNEYAITSLFRRTAVELAGGWRDPLPEYRGYEDWNLWMDLAERGERVVHLHAVLYRRRLHAPGLDLLARQHHAEIYCALRQLHKGLFADLAEHRRRSTLSRTRKVLYPLLYGDRKLVNRVRWIKPYLDRAGVWTLSRRQRDRP